MNTSEITGQRRPIGYWIKHLHGLVEGSLDGLLAGQGLTRRHWQVLNVVATDSPTLAGLDTALAPFLDDRRPSLRPLVDDLRGRGWLKGPEGEGRLALTAAGIRAHQELRRQVNADRARLTEGIGAEEYLATIDVLTRMSANLTGPTEPAKPTTNSGNIV
ncbi:MarR family winged helix-turn-helix transcriptional regulator [Streptosporangium sp. NPDC049644]|uniref:MarR family winged helix-turn-helix transcriptional regulator n=1 Tax=Streptosporangium sp. NPDC049644 TaxID=3155507 RepID=UPI00342E877B